MTTNYSCKKLSVQQNGVLFELEKKQLCLEKLCCSGACFPVLNVGNQWDLLFFRTS